ncbi:TPA: hypothetical protein R1699_000310 [Campylobacter lari]|nr:hypothetical protein [Campylobacter lari]
MKKIIVFWVRYSLILKDIKGFNINKNISYEEYKNKILDINRLKLRQHIFVNQVIPHIVLAKSMHPDLDIRIQLHCSTLLPNDIKNELLGLSLKYYWIEPLFFDPEAKYSVKPPIVELLKRIDFIENITPIACVRLDDDDILSPEYFTLLKKYIKEGFLGFVFSAPRGFYATYYNGKFLNFTKQNKPKIALGLAYIAGWNKNKCDFSTPYFMQPGGHNDTDIFAPVILDGSKEVYIRTLHECNDNYYNGKEYCSLGKFETMFGKYYVKEFENISNFFPLLTYHCNHCYFGAKSRIQNQLSYKLGQAMIINSKSILGYIRMPFVLFDIKEKYKQEQKKYQEKIKQNPSLELPPLETYLDYKEALKEKECLTYKLGQALIQANKTWYGGGYIKLLFEIRKLKREHKNKKI